MIFKADGGWGSHLSVQDSAIVAADCNLVVQFEKLISGLILTHVKSEKSHKVFIDVFVLWS